MDKLRRIIEIPEHGVPNNWKQDNIGSILDFKDECHNSGFLPRFGFESIDSNIVYHMFIKCHTFNSIKFYKQNDEFSEEHIVDLIGIKASVSSHFKSLIRYIIKSFSPIHDPFKIYDIKNPYEYQKNRVNLYKNFKLAIKDLDLEFPLCVNYDSDTHENLTGKYLISEDNDQYFIKKIKELNI